MVFDPLGYRFCCENNLLSFLKQSFVWDNGTEPSQPNRAWGAKIPGQSTVLRKVCKYPHGGPTRLSLPRQTLPGGGWRDWAGNEQGGSSAIELNSTIKETYLLASGLDREDNAIVKQTKYGSLFRYSPNTSKTLRSTVKGGESSVKLSWSEKN